MTLRSALAAMFIAPFALAVLTGCGSNAARSPAPRTTITLSQNVPLPLSPGAAPPRTLPTKTVALSQGQSLAVLYGVGTEGVQWAQTTAGDSRILRQVTTTASTCTSATVGCEESAKTTYTARAAGTTTVRWSFIYRGFCQDTRKPCPVAVQTIHVIVQR